MIREVKLGDILEYEQPNMYIVKNTNYDKKFSTPVLTAGQSFILGYTNEKENIFKAKENPVIIFDDFTTTSKYVDFDFKVKSSAMKILKAREGINIKYVYYAMQNIKFDNQLHKRYWISEYSKIKLLILDIKMQEKIVKELDLINKLLDYKKKQIELFDDFIKSQFIDLDLKIAGWDSTNIREEVEVKGMPNTQEAGYVDYVLYGENGKPLAVVEAKRTSKDSKIGQQQAKLYADCLEKEYAQRPIIYYTNGKEIYMWDDLSYPERKVSGYYTQDELQLLIKRRDSKENLEHIFIANDIANRPYQLEAVKKVCESFEEKHRRALVVMATGTGKTRTAISLVDVLTSKNWVQNVLFLADRTELVKQAEKNFKKLLPDMSCCNLLSSKDGDPEESRIIFSTYQTMINCIDKMKSKNGITLFTPGHFDLIIIDEAHRSIYKKYQAIFDYFDGLLVGLTATPRDDVDKNTYKFFQLENNVPTFVYEYDEAVKQKYLVDYHTISTTTKFIERGIKYSELKEEDREEYENLFEEGEVQEEISSNAINSWLFNRDTIKIILETVMQKGLKVEGGDKLRKNYNIC